MTLNNISQEVELNDSQGLLNTGLNSKGLRLLFSSFAAFSIFAMNGDDLQAEKAPIKEKPCSYYLAMENPEWMFDYARKRTCEDFPTIMTYEEARFMIKDAIKNKINIYIKVVTMNGLGIDRIILIQDDVKTPYMKLEKYSGTEELIETEGPYYVKDMLYFFNVWKEYGLRIIGFEYL